MQQPSYPLEREILDCLSEIEVLRLISVVVSSKEEQRNVNFYLALNGKNGRAHNFVLVVKKCGSSDDDDKNTNNNAAVITTDEAGHSYILSTDDKFLLDNLWVENCQEGLKEKNGNLNDVLEHLTDVFNNIMLEMGRVDSAEEEYNYEDDSELSENDMYNTAKPFSSKFEVLAACAGTGTVNHTAIEDGMVHKREDEMLLSPNFKRAWLRDWHDSSTGASSSCVTRNTRLMKDLSSLMKTDTTVFGFSIDPVDDYEISLWNIHLFNFEDCALAMDMKKMEIERGIKTIELQLNFPNDYPYSPPQARIIQPRFKPGKGFIVNGGFCIDLLTKEVCFFVVVCVLYFMRKTNNT